MALAAYTVASIGRAATVAPPTARSRRCMRAKTEIDTHSRPRARGTQAQRRWSKWVAEVARASRLVATTTPTATAPGSTKTTRAHCRFGRSARVSGTGEWVSMPLSGSQRPVSAAVLGTMVGTSLTVPRTLAISVTVDVVSEPGLSSRSRQQKREQEPWSSTN